MFKIQVTNFKGVLENHLWQNEIEDDFIQFLPKHFGVPKENFSIFYFTKAETTEAILHYKDNENNYVDLSLDGIARVCRRYKKQFNELEAVDVAQFELKVKECKSCFSDMTPVTIPVPTLEQEIDPATSEVIREFYTIPAGHLFTADISQDIKTYTGTPLTRWPYDEQGNFLGNK